MQGTVEPTSAALASRRASLETTQWEAMARAQDAWEMGAVEDPELQRTAQGARKALWPWITERQGAAVLSSLYRIDDALGGNRQVPRFDLHAVVEGRRSLLSLGEGDSGFVPGILRDQRKLGIKRPTVHAVDAKLPTRQDITDWPNQYHRAYFEDLDLRARDGKRLRFQEIIASHSVTRAMQIAPARQGRRMLLRAVDHLAPGGVLRAWPVEKSIGSWLRDEVAALKKKGIVAEAIVRAGPDDRKSYLIIRKK